MNSDLIGHRAYILYKGGVKGEPITDDHSTGEPLMFILGDLRVPKGIEEIVATMKVGEERTEDIPPELAYGEHQEKFVQRYTRAILPKGYELKVGDMFFWHNEKTAMDQPVWVREETQDTVTLDFNHPYAGKTLTYWIKLVDFR